MASVASLWMTKDKDRIQLSLKYKTDDQLFFSFFREAGHILLHGKKRVFVEDGQAAKRSRSVRPTVSQPTF